MNDIHWRLSMGVQSLTSTAAEARQVWNNTFAAEMRSRLLDPHASAVSSLSNKVGEHEAVCKRIILLQQESERDSIKICEEMSNVQKLVEGIGGSEMAIAGHYGQALSDADRAGAVADDARKILGELR